MGVHIRELKPNKFEDSRYSIYWWFKSNRHDIYKDQGGKILSDRSEVEALAHQIGLELNRAKTDPYAHDPYRYLPEKKNKFTFKKLAEQYLSDRRESLTSRALGKLQIEKSEKAFEKYFIPHFEFKDVREIVTYDIHRLINDSLPKSWGKKTLQNNLIFLKTFLNHLEKTNIMSRAPQFPDIGIVPKPAPNWIDYETQNKIIEQMDSEVHPIFLLLARMGCRPGEARALQKRDFNFTKNTHGTIRFERAFSMNELMPYTKTERSRELIIHPEIRELLKKLVRQKVGPESFIFTNNRGLPYTYNQISSIWAKAAKKAGANINCYAGTRHSVASQMINNGEPELVVKAILGHQSLSMTENYAHPSTETMVKAYTTKAKVMELKRAK